MTMSVSEMLMEVKDKQKEFDDFWKVHRSRVEHIMRMCHFARSGEKVRTPHKNQPLTHLLACSLTLSLTH